jgi:hypothetical protein
MLESPAFMILSGAAQRVLFRLEIELLHHGGNDNGKLVVTFDQFEKYLVRRKSIASALLELEALGFIEVVEHGCAGNAGYGKPNVFRLTYLPSVGAPEDGSHEWRRIKTMEDALRIQKDARATPPQNSVRRGGSRVRKIKTPVVLSPLASGAEAPLKRPNPLVLIGHRLGKLLRRPSGSSRPTLADGKRRAHISAICPTFACRLYRLRNYKGCQWF